MLEEIDGLYYMPIEVTCHYCLQPAKWKVFNVIEDRDEEALTCDDHKMIAFRLRESWQAAHKEALGQW